MAFWGGIVRSSHGGGSHHDMKDESHRSFGSFSKNVRRGSRSLLLSGDHDLATLLIDSFGAKQEVHAVTVTESLLDQLTDSEAVRLVEAIGHLPYLDTFEIIFPQNGIVSVAEAVVSLMSDASRLHSLTITNMDMNVYTQQFISASQGHSRLKNIKVKACSGDGRPSLDPDTFKSMYGFSLNKPKEKEGGHRSSIVGRDNSPKRSSGGIDATATKQREKQSGISPNRQEQPNISSANLYEPPERFSNVARRNHNHRGGVRGQGIRRGRSRDGVGAGEKGSGGREKSRDGEKSEREKNGIKGGDEDDDPFQHLHNGKNRRALRHTSSMYDDVDSPVETEGNNSHSNNNRRRRHSNEPKGDPSGTSSRGKPAALSPRSRAYSDQVDVTTSPRKGRKHAMNAVKTTSMRNIETGVW